MTKKTPSIEAAPSHRQHLGPRWLRRVQVAILCAGCALSVAAVWLRADDVKMQNGDHYYGKVLSLDTNSLVLRSDVLGTIRLPRGKVTLITLGSSVAASLTRDSSATNGHSGASSVALTNGITDLSTAFQQLGANTNFIQQVREQFLGTAGPEANNKFNEMVAGLMSGRLTVSDIRAEAKSAADQLKELKRDLGEDAGWALDGYLAILEHFLQETTPPSVSGPATKSKPDPVHKQK